MLKTSVLALGMMTAFTLASACSDDSDKTKADQSATLVDRGVSETSAASDANTAGANSGQICDNDTPCPKPTEESCFLFQGRDGGAASTTTSMCLGKCAKSGDSCYVPSPSTQRSVCYASFNSQLYCMYICEAPETPTSATIKTYKCPNDSDYVCETYGGSGKYKFCQPKE